MKKRGFNDLVSSIQEAGTVRRGEARPARAFEFKAQDVRSIRTRLQKTQAEFALMIGVSVSTLRNWEQGRRRPDGPAMALLRVAAQQPEIVADAPRR